MTARPCGRIGMDYNAEMPGRTPRKMPACKPKPAGGERRDDTTRVPKQAPAGPKADDAPPRDTRESPAPNPAADETTTPKNG